MVSRLPVSTLRTERVCASNCNEHVFHRGLRAARTPLHNHQINKSRNQQIVNKATMTAMFPFRGVDYLEIDSLFSEQELMVRQTTRRFVEDRVVPIIEKHNREATF